MDEKTAQISRDCVQGGKYSKQEIEPMIVDETVDFFISKKQQEGTRKKCILETIDTTAIV